MKPYQQIPISECNEPLSPIPSTLFAIEEPHPYVKLAAPYSDKSPYYLRQGVLEQLIMAQAYLQQIHPGWRIQIFDAYRPLAVQQFMVNYTFAEITRNQGLHSETLPDAQRQTILQQVYKFWALPSLDPATPPPHSTGAAVDITLVDGDGQVVNMGSPIDELSPRSYPDYFAPAGEQAIADQDAVSQPCGQPNPIIHGNRQLLRHIMTTFGFCQHPNEWWHFSLGDQLWAWQMNQDVRDMMLIARYGAVEHMTQDQ